MDINVLVEATSAASKKLSEISVIENYLNNNIKLKDYGTGIQEMYITLSCYDPNFGALSREWETGTVIDKKYIKSRHKLEITTKINHSELLKAEIPMVSEIIKQSIVKTLNDVSDIGIKNFDLQAFYRDLNELPFKSFIENKNNTYEDFSKVDEQHEDHLTSYTEMSEDVFWNLIDKSLFEKSQFMQIEIIINNLSNLDDENIIGFEVRLREKLLTLNNDAMLNLCKTIEGPATSDSFLYFRCALILLGSNFFNKLLQEPSEYYQQIVFNPYSEQLLIIADKAFKLKKGGKYNGELPRDIIGNFKSYNDLID